MKSESTAYTYGRRGTPTTRALEQLLFDDARISGAYILDPWYPWWSSIWGQSDPPGTFQDASEMGRNFLPWQRPEGNYPDRDGKFIVVIPTIPAG